DAPAAQRRVCGRDVRDEIVDDRRRVIELGRFGEAEHDGRRAALEERHLGRRLEQKRHAEGVAIEADGPLEIAGADEDLADGGEAELLGGRGGHLSLLYRMLKFNNRSFASRAYRALAQDDTPRGALRMKRGGSS